MGVVGCASESSVPAGCLLDSAAENLGKGGDVVTAPKIRDWVDLLKRKRNHKNLLGRHEGKELSNGMESFLVLSSSYFLAQKLLFYDFLFLGASCPVDTELSVTFPPRRAELKLWPFTFFRA